MTTISSATKLKNGAALANVESILDSKVEIKEELSYEDYTAQASTESSTSPVALLRPQEPPPFLFVSPKEPDVELRPRFLSESPQKSDPKPAQKRHDPSQVHPCSYCNFKTASRNTLYGHIVRAHRGRKFECNQCERKFSVHCRLRQHLKTHEAPDRSEIHFCPECDFTAHSRPMLRSHVSVKHSSLKFKCDYCNKMFTLKSTLRQHITEKHITDPQMCIVCGTWFRNCTILSKHNWRRHTAKSLVCDFPGCTKSYLQLAALETHRAKHTSKNLPSTQKATTLLQCEYCKVWFTEESSLNKHMRSKHAKKIALKLRGYQCDYCKTLLPKKPQLIQHINTEHSQNVRIYSCPHCDYTMNYQNGISLHIARKHRGYSFKCDRCSKQFAVKGDLTRHINNSHGVATLVCAICSRQYRNRTSLKCHHMAKHADRPFEDKTRTRRRTPRVNGSTKPTAPRRNVKRLVSAKKSSQRKQDVSTESARKSSVTLVARITPPLDNSKEPKYLNLQSSPPPTPGNFVFCSVFTDDEIQQEDPVKISAEFDDLPARPPSPGDFEFLAVSTEVAVKSEISAVHGDIEGGLETTVTSFTVKREDVEAPEVRLEVKQEDTEVPAASFEVKQESLETIQGSSVIEQVNYAFALAQGNVYPSNVRIKEEVWIEDYTPEPGSSLQKPQETSSQADTRPLPSFSYRRNTFPLQRNQVPSRLDRSKLVKCEVCDRILISSEALDQHIIEKHSKYYEVNAKPVSNGCLRCNHCHFEAINSSSLLAHIQWMHLSPKFECQLCEERFSTKIDLQQHIDGCHSSDNSGVLLCSKRTFPITPAATLQPDTQQKHEKLECDYCKKKFTQKRYLKMHMEVHIGAPRRCGTCDCWFKNRRAYDQHRRIRHKPQDSRKNCPRRCGTCSLWFQNRRTYDQHRRAQHKAQDSHKNSPTEQNKPVSENVVRCAKCSFTTKRLVSLHAHTRRMHGGPTFACDYCKRKFARKSFLKMHIEVHACYPQRCEVCGSWFKNRRTYDKHQRTQHKSQDSCTNPPTEQTKPRSRNVLFCSNCTYTTNRPALLHAHILWEHEGPRFECDYCKKRFAQKRNLKSHIETHMSCPEPCKICGLWFKNHRSRNQHWRTQHKQQNLSGNSTSGQNNQYSKSALSCAKCTYTTDRPVSLRAHTLKEHEGPRFECEHCKKKFMTKVNLKTHQITHIGSLEPCKICGLWFQNRLLYGEHWRTKHKRDISKSIKVDTNLRDC